MCVSLQTVKHLCTIPLCYWCESVWLCLVMQKETPHMKNAILQLTPGWRWWRWWWCLSGLSEMKYKHTTVNEWKNRSLMCEHSDTQCERFNTSVASVATFFRAKMLFTRNSTSVEKKTDSSFLQIIESYQSAPAPMSHISISTAVSIGHVRRVKCKLLYPCGLLISRETHLQKHTAWDKHFQQTQALIQNRKSAAHSSPPVCQVVFWGFLNKKF